ncbi:recombination-associated protein RdgC [Aromatoleum toluclasticum]|uniref:recombination-associated protein RdgC n=1 Tax=Aromatoleum toluclasticum TaxID=92003 RepID=UPI001D1876D8|nr:recombination-associated protein RdgC [Aromatoleum toluclasticum]MCC4116376.1 recombination-associated protein RdgC [Aromatoleum toluclasticum]
MFFKNLMIYRLAAGWDMTAEALGEQLARKRFQPCGNQDQETRGWVSPTGDEFLVHQVGDQWLIALGLEQKLLPSSVVKLEAEERAEVIAEQQGYRPGRKQMKDLREQVMQELLPRAFVRRSKVFAWIDPVGGWLGVDAPSQRRAEDVLEVLRQSLDSLPLSLLRTDRSPVSAMADWLAGSEAPAGFTIDQDCELRSVTEDHAAVRYVHHPLEGDEVRGHLTAGKLPTRLALTFDDRVSFVLTEKLEIKRIDFLDVVKEKLDEMGAEDARALFDAGFALMTGELQRLLSAVVEAMGGELRPLLEAA